MIINTPQNYQQFQHIPNSQQCPKYIPINYIFPQHPAMQKQSHRQIIFEVVNEQISYQKTYPTETTIQTTLELLLCNDTPPQTNIENPNLKSEKANSCPSITATEKTTKTVPAGTTVTENHYLQYPNCPASLLEHLGREGHTTRTEPVRKKQSQIRQLKQEANPTAQTLHCLQQKITQLLKQQQRMKAQITQMRSSFTTMKIKIDQLEQHYLPKHKLELKLAHISKQSPRFIYLRCLHRSLNSFFQSVMLSNSDYLNINKPYEYYLIKKIAEGISQLVSDIPIAKTIFGVVKGGLTFVLEALEEEQLRKIKAKVNRLVSSSTQSIYDQSQNLSISIMDSLIDISGLDAKQQEMNTVTQTPLNFESYRNLSRIQHFQQVCKQLTEAIGRGFKQKSKPDLTALYADCDYAKVMKRLFDSKEEEVDSLHDLLTQALIPTKDGLITPTDWHSRNGEDVCCACM